MRKQLDAEPRVDERAVPRRFRGTPAQVGREAEVPKVALGLRVAVARRPLQGVEAESSFEPVPSERVRAPGQAPDGADTVDRNVVVQTERAGEQRRLEILRSCSERKRGDHNTGAQALRNGAAPAM